MTNKAILTTILCAALAGPGLSCSDDSDNPAGGDGGVSGDSGTSATALTFQELTTACVRASACRIKRYARVRDCIDAYHNLYVNQGIEKMWSKIYRCVNSAGGDCTKTAACFGQGSTCDKTYKGSCSGDVAVGCDLGDGRVYKLNCGDSGQKCVIRSGQAFNPVCSPGSCLTSLGPSCQNNVLYSCNNGALEQRDCSVDGLKCLKSGKSGYNCIGETSETCYYETYVPACTGTTAKTCVSGRVHVDDCSRYVGRKSKCYDGDCVVAGSECKDDFNVCVGDDVKACIDGKWVTYGCAKLGLGKCRSYQNVANCTNPSI